LQEIKVDIHHYPVICLVMAGLKSFLYGVAPILGTSPAALYERQRALVNLGVLKAAKGRGPGSGVPLTAENVGAVVISLLAAQSLSKIDQYVVDLCNAQPEGTLPLGRPRDHWVKLGKPTFVSDVGRVLAGQNPLWRVSRARHISGIRVTRPWRGQIVDSSSGVGPMAYYPDDSDKYMVSKSISITAEIESEMLSHLVTFTKGALSQVKTGEDDE
jgi:hypothetical protein